MEKESEVIEVERFIKTADLVALWEAPDGTRNLTPEYVSALVKQGKIPAYRFKAKGHLFFRLSEVVAALRVKPELEPRVMRSYLKMLQETAPDRECTLEYYTPEGIEHPGDDAIEVVYLSEWSNAVDERSGITVAARFIQPPYVDSDIKGQWVIRDIETPEQLDDLWPDAQ